MITLLALVCMAYTLRGLITNWDGLGGIEIDLAVDVVSREDVGDIVLGSSKSERIRQGQILE